MSISAGMKRALAGLLLGGSLVLLVGCGVVEDALLGASSGSSPSSASPEPSATADGSILVTVEIDSGATATCERPLRLGPS